MGLDIENGALGAEYELNKIVVFFLQNITDSTVYRNWVQNITNLQGLNGLVQLSWLRECLCMPTR